MQRMASSQCAEPQSNNEAAVSNQRFAIIPSQGVSEPVIPDALAIARQILELPESIEMIDWNLRYELRLGEPQVDCDAPSPIIANMQSTPISHAPTDGAEMKADGIAPYVGVGST
jgi:hypothetical protein